jgi:hypothetical protein
MKKIAQILVDQMNKEVSSENFWEIVDKYHLETPEKYSHIKFCEKDGIEVWGESIDGELLVYDADNGFYLLPLNRWIKEVRDTYGEEADEILEEMGIYGEVSLHEFRIYGIEAKEKTATPANSTSNRVYVPKDWTRVMVVRLE